MFLNAIILESGVQFLSAENLPAVVNISCCTNMLTFHTRYVEIERELERLFRQK